MTKQYGLFSGALWLAALSTSAFAVPVLSGWIPQNPIVSTNGETPITVRKNDIILEQPVVPLGSAKLESDLQFKSMKIAANTELFGGTLVDDGRKIYCSDRMHPNGNILGRQYYCFDDADGDGQLDGRWGTFLSTFPGPTTLPAVSQIWAREPMPPVRYTAFPPGKTAMRYSIGIMLQAVDLQKGRVTFTPFYRHDGKLTKISQPFDAKFAPLPITKDILGATLQIMRINSDSIDVRVIRPIPDGLINMNVEVCQFGVGTCNRTRQ